MLSYHGSKWYLLGQRGFRPTEAGIYLSPVSRGLIQKTAPVSKSLIAGGVLEQESRLRLFLFFLQGLNATGEPFLSGFPVSELQAGVWKKDPGLPCHALYV